MIHLIAMHTKNSLVNGKQVEGVFSLSQRILKKQPVVLGTDTSVSVKPRTDLHQTRTITAFLRFDVTCGFLLLFVNCIG